MQLTTNHVRKRDLTIPAFHRQKFFRQKKHLRRHHVLISIPVLTLYDPSNPPKLLGRTIMVLVQSYYKRIRQMPYHAGNYIVGKQVTIETGHKYLVPFHYAAL